MKKSEFFTMTSLSELQNAVTKLPQAVMVLLAKQVTRLSCWATDGTTVIARPIKATNYEQSEWDEHVRCKIRDALTADDLKYIAVSD